MKNKHDWKEIQKAYDQEGLSWRGLIQKFGISMAGIHKAQGRGDFKSRSSSDGMKLHNKKNPRPPMTEELKKQISIKMKQYMKDNPDKVPYKVNHSSKESYPQKYFRELFQKQGIKLEKQYHVSLYSLDFACLERKIDIEINGEQHYVDKKIVQSDIERKQFLQSLGWNCVVIRWSDYQKLDFAQKEEVISNLKQILIGQKTEMFDIKELIPTRFLTKTINCLCCQKEFTIKTNEQANYCSEKCRKFKQRKVERPTKQILEQEYKTMPITKIAEKYGMSDNGIKKWLIDYGIYVKTKFKKGEKDVI